MSAATGRQLGLALCRRCHQVARLPHPEGSAECPRCGARLAMRPPDGTTASFACLIAAMILYLPANLLPVMRTTTVFGTENDTIMSGVLRLVTAGSWPLGVLVFFASIVVPMLKLAALGGLILQVRRQSTHGRLAATRLYRVVEFVGRWSMLDIYVVTLLVGLVQIRTLATVEPGGGALAFGAVVVLTMLSAQSFDPRLIWDSDADAPGAADETARAPATDARAASAPAAGKPIAGEPVDAG